MAHSLKKAAAAGFAGTAVMTMLMLVAPKMGMPRMDIAGMLASKMGGIIALGWMAHFVIGSVLAIIYAAFLASRIPGPGLVRGVIYSLIPWLVSQMMVMPMMGMGLFGGSVALAGGSLMGHMVYGAVLGGILGTAECSADCA